MKTTESTVKQYLPVAHTPLPWNSELNNGHCELWRNDKAHPHSFVGTIMRTIDADFIALACNSHYGLLESCKALLSIVEHVNGGCFLEGESAKIARKLIAKAEGKE